MQPFRRNKTLQKISVCFYDFIGDPEDGSQAEIDILLSGGPGRNTDAHGCMALPDGGAGPAGAVILDGLNYLASLLSGSKRYQYLVDGYLIKNKVTTPPESIRHKRSKTAAAFDQVCQTPIAPRSAGLPIFQPRGLAGRVRVHNGSVRGDPILSGRLRW